MDKGVDREAIQAGGWLCSCEEGGSEAEDKLAAVLRQRKDRTAQVVVVGSGEQILKEFRGKAGKIR